MNKKRILFCLLILVIIAGCNKNQKPEISDKYYNVIIIDSNSIDATGNTAKGYYFENRTMFKNYIYMYSPYKFHHIFRNDNFEIFNTHLIRFGKYPSNNMNMIIGYKNIQNKEKENYKGYYIFWKLYSGIKDQDWHINNQTDTVYSNISQSEILRLFPDFEGIVIDADISKIIVNSKYRIDNCRFYKDIEIIGFDKVTGTKLVPLPYTYDEYIKHIDSINSNRK